MTASHPQHGDGGQVENIGIPDLMIQQAGAAMASETDEAAGTTAAQQHTGHDRPTLTTNMSSGDIGDNPVPPPAFGERYGKIRNDKDGFGTDASVGNDGRVNIRINQTNHMLSSTLLPTLKREQTRREKEEAPPQPYIPPYLGGSTDKAPPPPLNVVIQIVGSRGDVQPFVALGKVLKDTYGHRVRLATHPNFKDFVLENGLEFFSIGADPAALMAFMVKNPGLMPSFDALRAGDVGKRRQEVGEYLRGCWRSCYETGDGTGVPATDETIEDWLAHADGDDHLRKPFVADCIIANPPSFAHVHIAEKMGIPVHCYFTMPYSPTQAFPHALANIQSSNADENLTNYLSYTLIDMLTWQGLGDVINRFRQRSLGLEPISLMWAPGMLQRLRIPFTYCWSPALIPKPKDWGANISISGFFFLDLATNFTPDPDLQAFLDAGPPPVYIGFGSIVLDDPNQMTKLIFEAVRKTGQRALVSKGWGGMGADELGKPDNVFMLGNCPHDWLFKRVSCVVHHGGAGTTAAGITAGRPTVVVPFFGDQPFWGAMVARAGAGPPPIHNKQLTAENLAAAIRTCLEPASQAKAAELAAKIATERGTDEGAKSFHQFLQVDGLRCNLSPSRVAVWRLKRTQVRLSAMAACTLANAGLLDFHDLKLFRAREYETDEGPWEPITGGASAIIGTASTMMLGVADFPIETLKALRIHPDTARAKKDKTATEADTSAGGSPRSHSSRPLSRRDSTASHSTIEQEIDAATTTTGSTMHSGGTDATDPTRRPTPSTSRTSSSFNFSESAAKLQSGTLSPTQSMLQAGKFPTSMADALSGNLAKRQTRSRSNSRVRSRGSSLSNGATADLLRTTMDTGKGVQRIVGAGLKSPMDFTLGVAKGFRNAPKLYGDDTVRKPASVTDFKSGVVAATKEFGLGMYDGITGLVSQPLRGAQESGPSGFLKGLGKGIGGLVLKPGAAVFSIPGYTMMGVYKEMQKMFGASVQGYIIAARTAQGFDEWQRSEAEERRLIIDRWNSMLPTLKKKRNPDELVRDILDEQIRKKEGWVDAKKAQFAERRRSRAGSTSAFNRSHVEPLHDPESARLATEAHDPSGSSSTRHRAQTTADVPRTLPPSLPPRGVLEETIRQSVLQTSSGDAADDEQVEHAMRLSVEQYLAQQQSSIAQHDAGDDDAELHRALTASAAAAEHDHLADADYARELEQALAQSLREHRGARPAVHSASSFEDDDPPPYEPGPSDTADFARRQAEKSATKTYQERAEEEIVLEYIKKQSLLETEHKQRAAAAGEASSGGRAGDAGAAVGQQVEGEDDEDLQRALDLSLAEEASRK